MASVIGGLVFAFLIAACPETATAAESSLLAMLGAAGPETLVVEIMLNTENKGQFFVSATDSDFLIRAADLKAIGLAGVRGRTQTIDGEEMIALKSIDGVSVRFDEKKLVLELAVD